MGTDKIFRIAVSNFSIELPGFDDNACFEDLDDLLSVDFLAFGFGSDSTHRSG